MDREPLQIRSYGVCFDLERRIYRLEQWRLPVAWGVPVRGILFFAATLLALLIAGGLPVIGPVVGALPAPARLALVPLAVAYALTALRVDGRPAHTAAGAIARHLLAPRWAAGFKACAPAGTVARLGDVWLAHDHSGPRLRRARVAGPCRVLLRYPGRAQVRRRGSRLVVAQTSDRPLGRGQTVALRQGQTLEVRSR